MGVRLSGGIGPLRISAPINGPGCLGLMLWILIAAAVMAVVKYWWVVLIVLAVLAVIAVFVVAVRAHAETREEGRVEAERIRRGGLVDAESAWVGAVAVPPSAARAPRAAPTASGLRYRQMLFAVRADHPGDYADFVAAAVRVISTQVASREDLRRALNFSEGRATAALSLLADVGIVEVEAGGRLVVVVEAGVAPLLESWSREI